MTCLERAVAPVAGEGASPALDRGEAGSGIAREYERRKSNREARVRKAHPRVGGLLLALREPPQHETAFHRGALGEKAVAESLERRTADSPTILLHSRRMSGGCGDIDHVAVTPTGVYVVDAKDLRGKVRIARPFLGAEKLFVSGRNRTKLIDGLDRQVAAVEAVVNGSGHPDVPVRGVLCFTKADLPMFGTLQMRGHLLLYRKALAKKLNADGPLGPAAIDGLAHAIAAALPSG
jgi:hypothetical protein